MELLLTIHTVVVKQNLLEQQCSQLRPTVSYIKKYLMIFKLLICLGSLYVNHIIYQYVIKVIGVNHLIMVRYVSQPTIIDINLMRKTSLKK